MPFATRRLHELKEECQEKGIILDTAYPYSKKELINMIREYHIKKKGSISWALENRLKIEPMVCFRFQDLKAEEKENLLNSKDWIIQQKYDGVRCLIFYHPNEGFSFFSRNDSVEDFLPPDFAKNVILKLKDEVIPALDLPKGFFKKSFVLDSEIIASSSVDTSKFLFRGVKAENLLQATTALLSIRSNLAHEIQVTQDTYFNFHCFDILSFDGVSHLKTPLRKRLALLEKVVSVLGSKISNFKLSSFEDEDKMTYHNALVKEGNEGTVLKNLNSEYNIKGTRGRAGWVKFKKKTSEMLGDIDAFVVGFQRGTPGTKNEHYVAVLELAVYVKDGNGGFKEHMIGRAANIPQELKEEITVREDGKVFLKEDWYNKVLVLDGVDISARAKRITHCYIDWSRSPRIDKNRDDCVEESNIFG